MAFQIPTDNLVAGIGSAEGCPAEVSRPSRRHIFLVGSYVAILLLVYALATTGIAGLPVQFVLKDRLKLTPTQLSIFGFLSGGPTYVGFAFGFLRDRWRPFGKGDRGYFLAVPGVLAAICFFLAAGPFTYARLLAAAILGAAFGTLLGAAANGLTATIAQKNGMAGRLSVVLLAIPNLVGLASNAVGGHFSHTTRQQHDAQFISGLLCLPMIVMAFWRPREVFRDIESDCGDIDSLPASGAAATALEMALTPETALEESTIASLRRLLRSRAIYLPAAILFLWEFAPGWGTPLFYYLTNTVKLSEVVYGNSQALIGFGLLAVTLAYTFICRKVRLLSSLRWGTFLGVIGCPLFLLIHNALQANIISFLAGVSLGIALCAYRDLLIRCCPEGLEGAAFLLTGATSAIAGSTSDIFGSWLYEKGGFGLALAVTTVMTTLIFGVLPFIPRRLLALREGDPIVSLAARPAPDDSGKLR